MRLGFVLASLLLLSAAHAEAQCCGDCDGNGEVAINELVGAVTRALDGCNDAPATPTRRPGTPTRTPTEPPAASCPFQFNDAVSADDPFCQYFGSADSACVAPYDAVTSWTTSGTDVFGLVIADAGVLGVVARRTSPTSAAVQSIALGPDFENFYTTSGTLSLPNARAARFSIRALDSACGTLVHDGEFVGQVNTFIAATSVVADAFGLGTIPHGSAAGSIANDQGYREQLRALLTGLRDFRRRQLPNFQHRK